MVGGRCWNRRRLAGALMILVLTPICSFKAAAQGAAARDLDERFGSLASINLPSSWLESEESAVPPRRLVKFSADTGSQAGIFVFDPAFGIPASAAKAVHDVFDMAVGAEPIALTPAQVAAISAQLGNVGDNQFSNNNPVPGPRAPAFHVDAAKLVWINGKSVVRIDGSFVDDAGRPVNIFSGVFTPSDVGVWRMLSIYAQSADPTELGVLGTVFDTALTTITWRK